MFFPLLPRRAKAGYPKRRPHSFRGTSRKGKVRTRRVGFVANLVHTEATNPCWKQVAGGEVTFLREREKGVLVGRLRKGVYLRARHALTLPLFGDGFFAQVSHVVVCSLGRGGGVHFLSAIFVLCVCVCCVYPNSSWLFLFSPLLFCFAGALLPCAMHVYPPPIPQISCYTVLSFLTLHTPLQTPTTTTPQPPSHRPSKQKEDKTCSPFFLL